MAFFAAVIIISCTPLKCGPREGLKCHLTPWLVVVSWIFLWSKASNSFSSLLSPTKLVPLSHTMSLGRPRRDTIRKNAFRNESVSRLNDTLRWMARVARQVNRQRYLFWRVLPLPCLVMNEPPNSTEVWLKARNDIRVRSSGNWAIICLAGVAFLLLHCIHALSHSLIASLAEIIQWWVEVLITLDCLPHGGSVHEHAWLWVLKRNDCVAVLLDSASPMVRILHSEVVHHIAEEDNKPKVTNKVAIFFRKLPLECSCFSGGWLTWNLNTSSVGHHRTPKVLTGGS